LEANERHVLDPLLACAAFIVEGDDPLGHARIKLASLDLGDHQARLGPASRLIGKTGVEATYLVRRSPDRTLEQVADPALQDLVGRQSDRVFDQLRLHELPAVGTVNVAWTQRAAFQIAELVEHEQRVKAGAGLMTVPDAGLLFAMGRAYARIHVKHNATRRSSTVHEVDPPAG
jgi:hypothetical protein